MSFFDLAKERYSVRKFSDKPVEQNKLDLILEAGRVAPTAHNKQPQRVFVIRDQKEMEVLNTCIPYQFGHTLALLVCYDEQASWKRELDGQVMGMVDASIVATHMMLQGWELGIGSTWVGNFDPKEVVKTFHLPESMIPAAILTMGYPAENARPSRLHDMRVDKEETIFYHVLKDEK